MRGLLNLSHARLLLLGVALLAALPAAHALGQEPPPERLSDQDPFDRITLDEENKGAVLKVEPLKLPNRRVPENPDPESKLQLQLFGDLDNIYEVRWQHIVKIEFYEDMVLAQAKEFMAADRLDDAYDALQHLKLNFPQTPGLEDTVRSYLYISAGRLFRQQRWAEALAVLEELHKLNPDYQLNAESRPLPQVIAAVLERIIAGYIEQKDYRTARLFLKRIRDSYGERHEATVRQWEGHLQMLATRERDAARSALAANNFREANRALRRMNEIWPDLSGGAQVASALASRYPILSVGVTQPFASLDIRRIDDWGARRAGRLTSQTLVEFLRPGAEGGEYAFRLGSLQVNETRRRMTLQLANEAAEGEQAITGYDLAEQLARWARPGDPEYSPTWAAIFAGANVRDVMRVEVDLRHSYVTPIAPLYLPSNLAQQKGTLYEAHPAEGAERPLIAMQPGSGSALPSEVNERLFDDSPSAVAALLRGEIDVVDRLFPADVPRYSVDSSVKVGRYALPTLHMLVPTPDRKLAGSRTLRRAMVYGINRRGILREQLLGGKELPGCRLISGPFSPGVGDDDTLAYAADPRLSPREHDPRLAATLVALAKRELSSAAEKAGENSPTFELTLGHPASEVARTACQSIALQLAAIGLPCKLVELPPGETRDTQNVCDFVYAEVTIGEPLVDARRLLDKDGVARLSDPYVSLALRRLDEATNWDEARERLRDVHRQVHADVSIIPLWQLVEHYACRPQLAGPEQPPVTLYDDLSVWREAIPRAAAQAGK